MNFWVSEKLSWRLGHQKLGDLKYQGNYHEKYFSKTGSQKSPYSSWKIWAKLLFASTNLNVLIYTHLSAIKGVSKLLRSCIITTTIVQYSGAILVPASMNILWLQKMIALIPENCWNIISPIEIRNAFFGPFSLQIDWHQPSAYSGVMAIRQV